MPLDVWIHGAGYGETVVLAWHEAGKKRRRAAVIDSYGDVTRPEDCFAIQKLKELDDPELAFVCATHPHLDHTATLPHIMEEHAHRLKRVFWWGGHHRSVVGGMLGSLPTETRQTSAFAIQRRFVELMRGLAGDFSPDDVVLAPESAFVGIHHVYSAPLEEGEAQRLDIWSISPFLGPQKRYRESFEACIRGDGTVVELSNHGANDASLAFLVQYGRSQIILGGDTGVENWRTFQKEWQRRRQNNTTESPPLPELSPQVIKVSHHGSKTAVPELQKSRPAADPDMWPQNGGFFGTWKAGASQQIAVITPWSRLPVTGAAQVLPNNKVLGLIQDAGCKVYVTGGTEMGDPYFAGTRPMLENSYFHASVSADGCAHATGHLCEVFKDDGNQVPPQFSPQISV